MVKTGKQQNRPPDDKAGASRAHRPAGMAFD
jgi:hypothetical protein